MAPSAIATEGSAVVTTKNTNGLPEASTGRSMLLHRSLHEPPLHVVGAKGNYLELDSGRRIFDSTGGAAVACLGHGNERVKQAVLQQMHAFSYCHTLTYTSSVAEELAQELCRSTKDQMTKAYLVSSGSEAMEAAMKLARQYFLELPHPQPQRTRFIARAPSYHGNTLGALSMSGHRARRNLFEPILLQNISHISPCNAYRYLEHQETLQHYVDRLAQELDDEFIRIGPANVAACTFETVVGAALGCVPAVDGYFKAIKAVCDRHGALLILDEVMCGMGRSGTLHAWEQEGVVPDIQTIGKGLGGGYAPVAGVLINKRVVDVLDAGTGAFSSGQTYQGHPIACAAALEVQKIIREDDLVTNVREKGDLLSSLLRQELIDHPFVGDIRGRGLFWGIEFVQNKTTKEPFAPTRGVAMGVHQRALQHPYSISLYPGTGTMDGQSGDHVLLAPAYNVSKTDIEFIVERTAAVIRDFFET
ncbi:MAG: hypothetical protein M1828_005072 [Chrysothrix sp. TS-e1954]|nr:MAG: hypothetical protein M1828_005072 [Chrysothrix sp. TS-e1954]